MTGAVRHGRPRPVFVKCGDEDNGQTSAWYVFSAMGFYPVCPASGQFAVGTPLFKSVKVTRPDGKVFIVNAPDNSSENFYVRSMKVNGKSAGRTFLTFDELSAGAVIDFSMSSEPDKSRCTSSVSRPYSFSRQ